MVTVFDALVEPTDWLPKLTEEGLTLIFAYAPVQTASTIVMAAVTVRILVLIFPEIFMFFPRFSCLFTGPPT
jgi:hypothetical protein